MEPLQASDRFATLTDIDCPLVLSSNISALRLRCAAVMFDMDGVLVDSSQQIDQALCRWAEEVGVVLAPGERRHRSMTEADFVRLVAPWLDADVQAQRIREIEHQLAGWSTTIPGAAELYEQVPPSRRAVVTNGSRNVALARLASSQIPLPDVLVTADDVDHGKPAPDPYLLAARATGNGRPGPLVAIEDSLTGVRSARAANITAIALASSGTSDHDRSLVKEASYTIDSLHRLSCATTTAGEGHVPGT